MKRFSDLMVRATTLRTFRTKNNYGDYKECSTPMEIAQVMISDEMAKGKHLVDLGCGSGSLTAHLDKKACRCLKLVDTEISVLLRNQMETYSNVVLEQVDYTSWDWVSMNVSSYDFVVSNPMFGIGLRTLVVISYILGVEGSAMVIFPSNFISKSEEEDFVVELGLEKSLVKPLGNPKYFVDNSKGKKFPDLLWKFRKIQVASLRQTVRVAFPENGNSREMARKRRTRPRSSETSSSTSTASISEVGE